MHNTFGNPIELSDAELDAVSGGGNRHGKIKIKVVGKGGDGGDGGDANVYVKAHHNTGSITIGNTTGGAGGAGGAGITVAVA